MVMADGLGVHPSQHLTRLPARTAILVAQLVHYRLTLIQFEHNFTEMIIGTDTQENFYHQGAYSYNDTLTWCA